MRKLALALLLGLAACAPTRGAAYERSLAEGKRAYNAGRFDVAAERFAAASSEAKVPRDAVHARYESALARARSGDVARASRELRAIADAEPRTDYSASAAFKAAELTGKREPDAGAAEMEAVALRFPESGSAKVALARVLQHTEGDPALGNEPSPGAAMRALAKLDAIAPRVRGTTLEEDVLYQRARRLVEVGRLDEARTAFLEVADRWPYPKGAYFDDALYRVSEVETKLGQPAVAAEHLERLLSFREQSQLIGSYERPRYVPSLLRLARLYEVELHDRERARKTLHRLYADFPRSTLRDDALWREAALWELDGDKATACDRLGTLASDLPDSRYVPCVPEKCPGVKRPAKSKAPSTCHAYLLRPASPTPVGEEVAPTVDTTRPDDPK